MNRTAVQALQTRRRAQGDSSLPASVLPSVAADAARLESLKRGPMPELRSAADQELQRAQAALSEASGISWTGFLGLPMFIASEVADYRRWSPIKQLIEDGQKSLADGDKTFVEDVKRRAYASAWTSARTAQGAILRQAGDGKTGVVAILKEEAKAAGADPQQLADAARAAGKKVEDVAEGIGSVVKLAVIGVAVYTGVKLVGGLRG